MKRPFCQNPECLYHKVEVADDVFRISDIDKRVNRKVHEDKKGRKQFLCEDCYLKLIEENREIRQLWYVANRYFQSASEIKKKYKGDELHILITEISAYYQKSIPTNPEILDQSMLGAHLSSAAVRLSTICERFSKKGDTIQTNYMDVLSKKIYKDKDKDFFRKEIKKNLDDYLIFLLRDSVAHIERAEDKKYPCKALIYEARQDILDEMYLDDEFEGIQKAISRIENKLFAEGIITRGS